MNSSKCALNKSPNQDGSCLDNKHVAILTQHTTANTLKELKNELKCNDDECILEKINIPTVVEEQIKREAFKAVAESLDGNYWMNNTEIDTVLSQMRKDFPGFAHTFIHMSDVKTFPPSNLKSFNYNVPALTEINLGECLKKAINRQPPCTTLPTYNDVPLKSIGIVFNTDSSAGSGQHWFAVYISIDHKDPTIPGNPLILIEVFNSAGTDINSKAFQQFWQTQKLEITQITKCRCEYKLVSTIQHQNDDTGNCGSYSLFYIYSRLKQAKPEEFNIPGKKITDAVMQKFRSVCFRTN